MDIPAVLDHIVVLTTKGKSKNDFIKSTTDLLDTNLKTFDELIRQVSQVKRTFINTGCFKSVKVTIDTSEMSENHSPGGYQVFFELDEKILNLATHTGIDTEKANPEGSIDLSLPNLFGRGELLSIKFGRDVGKYEKSRGFIPNLTADFTKTMLDGKTGLHLQLKHDYFEKSWSNLCEEQMMGASSITYKYNKDLAFKATASSRLVNILGLSSRPVPLSLRKQFGYSKKNAANFELNYDTTHNFINNVVPTFGNKGKLGAEFWPGKFKTSADFCIFYTLFNTVTAKFVLSGGAIKTFNDTPVHYTEKYFLGGFNSVRGFHQNSIGPSESDCALGGDAYWRSGLHLYSKLDFLSQLTGGLLRNYFSPAIGVHAFAEAGNVGNTKDICSNPSISYGVGFAMGLAPGVHLELNTCHGLGGDMSKFKSGLNAGFSISI